MTTIKHRLRFARLRFRARGKTYIAHIKVLPGTTQLRINGGASRRQPRAGRRQAR